MCVCVCVCVCLSVCLSVCVCVWGGGIKRNFFSPKRGSFLNLAGVSWGLWISRWRGQVCKDTRSTEVDSPVYSEVYAFHSDDDIKSIWQSLCTIFMKNLRTQEQDNVINIWVVHSLTPLDTCQTEDLRGLFLQVREQWLFMLPRITQFAQLPLYILVSKLIHYVFYRVPFVKILHSTKMYHMGQCWQWCSQQCLTEASHQRENHVRAPWRQCMKDIHHLQRPPMAGSIDILKDMSLSEIFLREISLQLHSCKLSSL